MWFHANADCAGINMKITPNSLTLNQLFSSTNEQFVIPSYQRRYSWRERQVIELIEDMEFLENSDTHLLGSIVCLTGHHTAGLNRLELVDGQQRLTTISILLECLRERLVREGETDKVQELSRLLTAKALGGTPMPKIALDSIDGDEFRRLVENPDDSDATPHANHNLVAAFSIIRSWISDWSLENLGSFLYKLQNNSLIIRLDVSDAKDAFKLFETINNRGLKLSPTDIIKNFVLGNAARFGIDQLDEARKSWALLISYLDAADTDAFFRYFLISATQRRITKSQVVPEFKWLFMNEVFEAEKLPDRHLYVDEDEIDDDEPDQAGDVEDVTIERGGTANVTFKDFLRRVVTSAKVFGELVLIRTGDKRIDRHLRNLRMIKSAQTYGFLMHLRVGGMEDRAFVEVLKITENFILRRHVCRERANETETLFAKLCSIDPKGSLAELRAAYRDACPSDEKFRDEFATASYTANIIDRARYCLEQLELSKHGKHAELEVLGSDDVHVEHIIPQKIKTKRSKEEFRDWVSYLGDKADLLHPRTVSKIGNLTLFLEP
ncbi:DUF262 domain-containing protein [Sinorhizobium meliloti]|nr:DUF262 domain-containing protein [Sinorhizobium meliloti]MQX55666.1 DUF262 domain-containing protein [Sinorhizobium meliloti]